MKQRLDLGMALAVGRAWAAAAATAAGASHGWGEMPQNFGAAFVHHGFGAGAAPRGRFPSNTAALHAATDDSIDPFALYDESMPDTAPSPPSWGVADDWSKLTTANAASASFATPEVAPSGSYDVVDEAARLLEEQDKMMHEWETDDGAASGGTTLNAHHIRDPNDDAFVEDAIEVIAGNFDYDEGGVQLYDTLSSVSSAGEGSEDRHEEEELAFMVRCDKSPEQFLVSQGRALPELTEEEKYAPHFLLKGGLEKDRQLPLQPKASVFLEEAVRGIFDTYSVEEEGEGSMAVLDREGLSKWMTRCVSSPLASSNAKPFTIGPYDQDISATLSRYSWSHGSGRLTLEEFQALYLEVTWAGYVNDVIQKKTALEGTYPLPSPDTGVLIEGRKNTEKMLKQATLSLVWRDLEAHQIFSPAEEERVRLLREMELQQSHATTGVGKHSQLLMDECELFDEYEDRLSHRAYSEENDDDVLGSEHGWDFLERKEKGSHELVEMASDGVTPLRVRDGHFVFIDEESCIGCTQCAQIAPSSFKMIEDTGRARTFQQSNSIGVTDAVMACPVNCMHFLSFDELKEMEVSRDDGDGRTDHRHFGGRRTHTPLHVGGIDSDANHKSSWYHYLKWKCHGSSACPTRGCYDCPTYAPGKNPYFIERHDRAEHVRARDFLSSGEADKWRKVIEL